MESAKNLLIVEDEAPLLRILSDRFSAEGFRVFAAANGEEGLKMAFESKPDLMLIDILMPKMDGLTMLAKIRINPELANTPAIMLTNLNDPDATAKALESGAYDYIIKTDWDLDDVIKRVKEKMKLT